MSNEELAAQIQNGREELYPKLWDQVRRFVAQQARRRFQASAGFGGVEVDDLIQSGYLAMVEAVSRFDPKAECSFLTMLNFCLRTAFASAGGYKTSKRDMLDFCAELDAPLSGDDQDGTMLDYVQDPRDQYHDIEEKVYQQQLHNTLERAISGLPEKEANTIRRYYWDRQSLDQISAEAGKTREAVRRWKQDGLNRLKAQQHSNGLDQFVSERMDYYSGTNLTCFKRTMQSPTERKALQRISLYEKYKHLFTEDYDNE